MKTRYVMTWLWLSASIFSAFDPMEAQSTFWQQTNGPFGGKITSVATTPAGYSFAGAAQGVFRSLDVGTGWSKLILSPSFIKAILVDSSSIVFIGSSNYGVFRSLDFGDTWLRVYADAVSCLAKNSHGDIFAGRETGLYRSTNNGSTWVQTIPFAFSNRVNCISITRADEIFVGLNENMGFGGILRSTNNGNTWVSSYNGIAELNISSLASDSLGYIYAGTGNGKVYRSTNNGTTWIQPTSSLQSIVQSLRVSPTNNIFAGTSASGVYLSTDHGATWHTANIGLTSNTISDFAFWENQILAACGDGMVRSTNNGNTWSEANIGLRNVGVFPIATVSLTNLIAGSDFGLFRSTNGGTLWTKQLNSLPTNRYISSLAQCQNQWLLAGTYGQGIFRSTDGGITWLYASTGLSNQTVYCLVVQPNGEAFAGTYGSGIFRSSDCGNTWIQITSAFRYDLVYALLVNTNNDLYAGVDWDWIWRSTNNGSTWTRVNNGLTDGIWHYSIARNSTGWLFATSRRDGVSRTTNNGDVWTSVNGNLPSVRVGKIAVNSDDHIYVTTDDGLFSSPDNGTTWALVDSELTYSQIYCLSFDSLDVLYSGTSAGVYRSMGPTTSVTQTNHAVVFILGQNYPNPFNPTTNIGFQIANREFVTLIVFDLLGREVATLVNEEMEPGSYERVFNAEGLASGVYLYRLQAGGFVQTKKLLLLR